MISALTGCTGVQSVLDPAGPQAGRISTIWWLMFAVCLIIQILIIVFVSIPALRSRRERNGSGGENSATQPDLNPEPNTERRMTRVVIGAVAATVVILFVFLVDSFLIGRGISSVPSPHPLTIKVTGHQWWWEVNYENPVAARSFTTANEVHIPVGQPVVFKLTSQDVIHSFWVPNLHGKKDLVPGRESTTWLQADKPGIFRGQCAEFCGHQHAHMAFAVVAEPPEQFYAWYEGQIRPAMQPAGESQQKGRRVFLTSACVMCHTIQGTPAGATVGPNLTHVGSRKTIAAGTLANNRGNLGGWVTDSQEIKPGNRMPPNLLSPEDLQALLDYLESLK
jgi:cytochrome c oxidase subunit 2